MAESVIVAAYSGHCVNGRGVAASASMTAVSLIGVAASLSLLAGWRVYLCVLAAGLAMRTGWLALPETLTGLQVLANPWVIGVAAIAAVAEFFADKIMWVDTLWDAVHTAIRPVGGALLAAAVIDAHDPVWQVTSFLLGGGAALITHSAKAATRAAVNISPEPVTNIAVSGTEDVASVGLLSLALSNPALAIIVAGFVLIGSMAVLVVIRRALKRFLGPTTSA